MRSINHYTLNSGNNRITYANEAPREIYFLLQSIINKAKKGIVEVSEGMGMYIYITQEDASTYICTVYGKIKDQYVPVVITAGTKDESKRKYVWDTMEKYLISLFPGEYIRHVPVATPYIVDLVVPSSYIFYDILKMTGDFCKCLGWIMLFPEEMYEIHGK